MSKKKLLIVFGLPGIGKSELVEHSVSIVLKENPLLKVYKIRFPSVYGDATFNLENLAAMIYEEINPGICLKKHRVNSLSKLLIKTSKPTILVLEMSYSNFSQEEINEFWKLIQEVLVPENTLKIIITCCKKPDLSQSYHLDIEMLHLQELNQRSAITLLQHINPGLSEEHCSCVANYCYGNPFLVCKMGAHIKNFDNHDEDIQELIADLAHNSDLDYLQALMSKTVLKHDLEIVFEELDEIEKTTLVKMVCFYEKIPMDVVESVFGSQTKSLVKHIYAEHGLLERSNPGMYHMNELLRTFIQDYCQANEEFKELLLDSKILLIKFYSQFLCLLDEVFFVPSILDKVSQIKQRVLHHRSKCKKCEKGNCTCPIPVIMQLILQKVKASLFRYFQTGLHIDSTVNDVIDACCKAVHLLRRSLPYDELHALFEMLLSKADLRNDTLRFALILSNSVFIKTYHRVKDEREQNVAILTNCINFLEKMPSLNSISLETLANCYVNRGYLKGFYSCHFKDGISDIEMGRKILSRLTVLGRVEITYLATRGYLAGIFL